MNAGNTGDARIYIQVWYIERKISKRCKNVKIELYMTCWTTICTGETIHAINRSLVSNSRDGQKRERCIISSVMHLLLCFGIQYWQNELIRCVQKAFIRVCANMSVQVLIVEHIFVDYQLAVSVCDHVVFYQMGRNSTYAFQAEWQMVVKVYHDILEGTCQVTDRTDDWSDMLRNSVLACCTC